MARSAIRVRSSCLSLPSTGLALDGWQGAGRQGPLVRQCRLQNVVYASFLTGPLAVLGVMSRDVVLAPARNDTVPIQEVSVQTACH